ncbi:MAG: helix-turn-helix transcriptional regulator [Thermodesulfovibrionia bacterium]|nr:helix-turn-helix transcriptional regulator [Thermodesulfovibrionia bacterium]
MTEKSSQEKNRVREFRESNAWSISELARHSSLVPQTISKMEKGVVTSRNSQLKVAKALGKKYEEVFPPE